MQLVCARGSDARLLAFAASLENGDARAMMNAIAYPCLVCLLSRLEVVESNEPRTGSPRSRYKPTGIRNQEHGGLIRCAIAATTKTRDWR